MRPESITELLTSIANAYESYLNTRQEAYNRKMDKRQEKAIAYGKKVSSEVDELFAVLNAILSPVKLKEIEDIVEDIKKLQNKFNKYS